MSSFQLLVHLNGEEHSVTAEPRGRGYLVIADGRTYVDDRLIYEASDLRVGLFQSTEGF